MSPQAGWYPDPHDGRQLRYWDGTAWTESVAPAGPPAGEWTGPSGAADQRPPLPTPTADDPYESFWGPSAGAADYGGSGYGDVGEWLSATFSHLFGRIGPLAVLLFAIPFAALLPALVLGASILDSLEIDRGGSDVQFGGPSPGLLVTAAVALLVGLLIAAASGLGAYHQLYSAHAGQPQGLGRSLSVGFRRLPRAVGWGLVGLIVYVVLIIMAVIVVGVLAAIATDVPVFGVMATILAVLALICAAVWAGIRLSLIFSAIAVGPAGTNPFRASWEVTRDRWWGTLGRLILIGIIVFVTGLVLNLILQIPFGSTGWSATLSPEGELMINGRRVTGEVVRLSDHLPSLPWFIAWGAVSAASQGVQQAISIAATTGLYLRGNGPGEV